MWELKDKYMVCCHNNDCDSFDTCIDCWDEWAERNPPMTKADRIRAMSDEELVENFGEYMPDEKFCTGICNDQMDCDVCRLAWLKQPAEGE